MSINSIPLNAANNFIQKNVANLDDDLEQTNSEGNKFIVEQSDIDNVENKSVESTISRNVSPEELEKALEVVTSFLHSTSKQVDFSSDNQAGKTVITILDKETQEVINQFPSEKIILMAEKIKQLNQEVESISGLLIDRHI